jgi:phage shock protein E
MKLWIALCLVLLMAAACQPAATTSPSTTNASQDISPAQYQEQFSQATHTLIDVRTVEEYSSGHIAGSVNIAVDALASRLSEVPKDKPVIVYCRSGNRSATAAQILVEAGYTNVYDLGGIQAWQAAGLPVE